jgi:2,4-dienoyl-CoA reductase-like NADH-dependent reductase (Old Yellow Enzyme family)
MYARPENHGSDNTANLHARATNLHLAAKFKEAKLGIPVTTSEASIWSLLKRRFQEGKADVIAMIRAFIAEPELVNKARLGREEEIRPCIRCNVCTGEDPHGCPRPLRCTLIRFRAGTHCRHDRKVG